MEKNNFNNPDNLDRFDTSALLSNLMKEAQEAEERIRPYIRETPAELSLYLGQEADCEVFLKLENLQITGSFKLRGAMNKVLSLSQEELEKGIITASSGNHAAAFAYLMKRFGLKGTIFLPKTASESKLESLRYYDVPLELHGHDCILAETAARNSAQESGQVFISPYNDPKIVGGQATIGIELLNQLDNVDVVFAPIGGGGLISGIAGFLKASNRKIAIIGCQPENSPVMYESIKAGHILDMESKPSISDGTAGGIEKKAITFAICRALVDEYVLLSEAEIKDAIRLVLKKHSMLIEGAAALSVAAFLKIKNRYKGQQVALIISGAKISLDKLREVLC
ncbi:threonine/serine dehydratase [Acidobacteriota bacterium]